MNHCLASSPPGHVETVIFLTDVCKVNPYIKDRYGNQPLLTEVLRHSKLLQFHDILHFTLHQVGQRTSRWRHTVQPGCGRFHLAKVSQCVRLSVRSGGAEDGPDGGEHSVSYWKFTWLCEWQRRCRAVWVMVVWVLPKGLFSRAECTSNGKNGCCK